MKDKTCIIAKFRRTDSIIHNHSREGKTLSYNRINTIRKQYSNFESTIGFYAFIKV